MYLGQYMDGFIITVQRGGLCWAVPCTVASGQRGAGCVVLVPLQAPLALFSWGFGDSKKVQLCSGLCSGHISYLSNRGSAQSPVGEAA